MGKIRLWKLGNLEHKIVPTPFAATKLRELLDAHEEKGGTTDIIWGSDIEVETVEGDNDVILMEEECIKYLKGNGYIVSKNDGTVL